MKSNSYKINLTIVISVLIVFFVSETIYFFYAALIIGIAALSSTYLNNTIAKIWMQIAEWSSLFFPKILLSILYFLLLTPLAILARLTNKNKFLLLENNQDSFFKIVNKKFEKKDFEKMW
jgi:predicted membrane protein